MTPLFKKLNLKDQTEIAIVGAPQSFEREITALRGVAVRRSIGPALASKNAQGDAIVWFAYPKQSSKNYTCEFNRDGGWTALGAAGFEPVRMVAIDADWCAVRFRRVDFIKTMTRGPEHTFSAGGKAKAKATATAEGKAKRAARA